MSQDSEWSRWLYNVLIKFLIQITKNKGYSCILANLWVEYICYVDDVLLLSASIIKLQAIFYVCCKFNDDVGLLFDTLQSTFLAYNISTNFFSLPEVFLYGEVIRCKDKLIYLGICFIP